jgi:hypothetical protein
MLAEGLRLAESIPHVYLAVSALLALARLKLAEGTEASARIVAMQAEDCAERAEAANMPGMAARARSTWARALAALGQRERAEALISRALAERQLVEREEILWDRMVLWEGDAAHQVEREAALEEARALLRERAGWIEDPALRASFLARPLHRAIFGAEETAQTR